MIWCKQFFHYDVERWLQGDRVPPPEAAARGATATGGTSRRHDVLSMPDTWEYPWFAAWDLAFHCAALALVDVDFAKDQIELMLSERYLHPNGQIPAYEWNFGDVNPPVHAMGALKVFRAERVQRGAGRPRLPASASSTSCCSTYAWWINRKDADGHNVFEGGFLGLDNISVFDRSRPLPPGYSLKQADATGWMAMFALNMTVMALELSAKDPDYEDMAIQLLQAVPGHRQRHRRQRRRRRLAVGRRRPASSRTCWSTPTAPVTASTSTPGSGLIPLFATEIVDQRLLASGPALRATGCASTRAASSRAAPSAPARTGRTPAASTCSPWSTTAMLPRILARLLDEEQFLSPLRRPQRQPHPRHPARPRALPGIGEALIEYVPGESNSPLFGGNSNWRGPDLAADQLSS